MKIVWIGQSVDSGDAVRATAVRWIETLARDPRVTEINVISLREGTHKLPANVAIKTIGSRSRPLTLLNFLRAVHYLLRRDRVDLFFIHMGGPYPLLLAPYRLFLGKPVFQWKTHPHINWIMRLSLYIDTAVFTATRRSLPVDRKNVYVVGHGIHLDDFPVVYSQRKRRQLVTVGRFSAVKNIHEMVEALRVYGERYEDAPNLDIIGGPMTGSDTVYRAAVEAQIGSAGLGDRIRLLGEIPHGEIARLVGEAEGFLCFSSTALDKATLEAMALQVPVISTNACVTEILPPRCARFICEPGNPRSQAEGIRALLELPEKERGELGRELRQIVEENHTDTALFQRILAQIERML